jgi:hypothetical protein
MVYFQTKNTTLGKFWTILHWKILEHFMDTWSNLRPLGLFCGFYGHLVYFSRFGMLYEEKSGNPARKVKVFKRIFSRRT